MGGVSLGEAIPSRGESLYDSKEFLRVSFRKRVTCLTALKPSGSGVGTELELREVVLNLRVAPIRYLHCDS